jgi:uncharacterized protein YjiS (DUF1127 family)
MTHLIHKLNSFLQKIKELKDIRITENSLYKLSDRELNDIGISRGDIHALARGDKDHKRSYKLEINPNLKGWI